MPSPKKTNEMPLGVAALFTLIGAVILTVVLGVLVMPALWVQFAYRSTEAVVMDRRWTVHHGTKGSRYGLEALLAYQAGDREYQAWVEWPRTTGSRNGPEAEAVFDQVQVGQPVSCYRDPLYPEVVALDRDRWQWGYLGSMAFAGVCLLGGVAGMAASWHRTFPRGVGAETADLLRRLPQRFWLAAAGALLCAGVGFVALRDLGPALGGWSCALLVAAAGGLVLLLRWVARYGAVALPSAEKQAAAESHDLPAVPSESAATAGWNRVEPVEVQRGERLPVRLPSTLAGGGCIAGWCGSMLLVGLWLALLWWLKQRWPAPIVAALLPFLVPMFLAAAAVVILVIVWGGWRRVSKLAVEVSGHPLRAGGRYELTVSHPDPQCLRGLQLDLVCEEQSGEGKSTKRATPVRQPISLDPPSRDGKARTGWLEVPHEAPISFALEHNQVRWCLEVRMGGLLRWRGRCRVTIESGRQGSRPTPSQASRPQRLDEKALSLWIDGGGPEFLPGATLTGGYAVHAQEGTGPLRTVELSALWHADAPVAADLYVFYYEEHTAVDGDDLSLYAPRQYCARLPDGPPSYHGKVVRVQWVVRLRLRYVNGTEILRELPFRLVDAGVDEIPAG